MISLDSASPLYNKVIYLLVIGLFCVCVLVSQLCPTLCDQWTIACQAPLSMEFSRQEYLSGLPFPSPGDRPHPGVEPGSLALQVDSLPSEPFFY